MSENQKLNFEDFDFKSANKPSAVTNEQENLRNIIRESVYGEHERKNDDSVSINAVIPKSALERTIFDAMKNDKQSILLIRQKKTRLAEFDKKMKRIKQIKSRKYHKHLKMARKNGEHDVKVPDFLLKNIEEEKKDKVFFDEEMSEKIGKVMVPEELVDSESTDSECELFKNDSSIEDEHLEVFRKEKMEHMQENMPKKTTIVLPGWGSWGGQDIETKQTRLNTICSSEEGIAPRRRKDFKMGRVIINEDALKNNIKIELPYGYKKLEYEALLNMPVAKESNTLKIFQKFLKSGEQHQNGDKAFDTFEYASKYDKELG